ncbi:MAG: aminotransferase class I/II-fold pyridoxal phosphate-dependent enzyme, partial [Bacteroidetes bacterium]|nr:aminotransferase class I/II-fold pyridoxal phosphate-dependent enzyme [Bacteroidota bacterium]
MLPIPMVDLQTQYRAHQQEIDASIALCLSEGNFIGGKKITEFENKLAAYLGIDNCISCANGTDALQIALMALDLPKGSKIIVPAFTYIATAEVVKLLGFELVLCDVDVNTFNVNIEHIKAVYSEDVKAIIVVHLFGQVCDINEITAFCKDNNIFLIEDNAQALGA